MISNIIAATALLASAPLANALGNAIVKNACKYEVKMCNVPASGGGYQQIDKMLQPNETYTQQYTELSNGNGWAIKLSDDENLDHILQYEYTVHNDGMLWYDLSQVDGNPWYGNWQITTNSKNCKPKQQAYRYANDDAYGMQSCPDDADIIVTLCSGEGYNDELAAEASASVAAASQANTVPWTPLGGYADAATSVVAEATSLAGYVVSWGNVKAAAQPTTFATSASVAGWAPTGNIAPRETGLARRAHRRHGHNAAH
jgi:hypothetical protein